MVINAALAGFWAGLAAFAATGELSKTALFAAVAVGARAAYAYVSAHVDAVPQLPVDK